MLHGKLTYTSVILDPLCGQTAHIPATAPRTLHCRWIQTSIPKSISAATWTPSRWNSTSQHPTRRSDQVYCHPTQQPQVRWGPNTTIPRSED